MGASERKPHPKTPRQVWVDVDEAVAADVEWLNSLAGVRTFASCKGTLGEGGPHPYAPYVMAWWPEMHGAAIRSRFRVGERGTGWAYLHPWRIG